MIAQKQAALTGWLKPSCLTGMGNLQEPQTTVHVPMLESICTPMRKAGCASCALWLFNSSEEMVRAGSAVQVLTTVMQPL